LAKNTLLVADDDKCRLESIKSLLLSEGYLVDTAETGREAIEKLQERYYNLTLLGSKLANREGPEFLTRIREFAPQSDAIVVTDISSSKEISEPPDPIHRSNEPSDPEGLLKVVEEKLKEQAEVELYRSVIPWTQNPQQKRGPEAQWCSGQA
jgi:DNA-binding NtrC family response regulator